MNAIIFFTFRPPKEIFDFAKKLKNDNYDIFISINDNEYIIPEYDIRSIHIIKISDIDARNAGYVNSNNNMRGEVCSRDKAFYYFNRINNTNYKFFWFIEEDVFIPSTDTIKNIDKKYAECDYLSSNYITVCNTKQDIINYDFNKDYRIVKFNNQYSFFESWAFKDFNIANYFSFPWMKGMTCAIRVSKNFLRHIDNFALKHKTLIIDEVLYLSLAVHNNLSIINPIELYPILYRCNFNDMNIRSDFLYHPIKDLKFQNKIREYYCFE